jgi:hypothetical protein
VKSEFGMRSVPRSTRTTPHPHGGASQSSFRIPNSTQPCFHIPRSCHQSSACM